MSIRQIPLESLRTEMIPQAIIKRPLQDLADDRFEVHTAHDDFDEYLGAALLLNERTQIALKHYRGHPPGTTTLYLPADVSDLGTIAKIISHALNALNVPAKYVEWERTKRTPSY